MAEKIFRSASKELGLMTEKQFFQEVGNKAGYLDPEFVKRVYNGMLDVLYMELRTKGALRFPQLCDFYVLRTKPRRIQNHNMPEARIAPAHNQIRIRPMYSVKRYFSELDKLEPDIVLDPTVKMKALPPRKRRGHAAGTVRKE